MNKKVLFIVLFVIILLGVGILYKVVINPDSKYSERSLKDIKRRGKLVVGVYTDFAPMTFLDKEGNHIGYDIDLIREIANEIGVELDFKKMNFSELFTAVENKEVDLAISSITITTEREEKYLFSKPYFTSGQSILTRTDDDRILDVKDLKDMKIGVPHASTCEEAAKEKVANVEQVIGYKNNGEIKALLNKEVDAVVQDYSYAAYTAKQNDSIKLVSDPFTQEFYGIMTHKENLSLMDRINEILREVQRSGRQNEFHKTWFGQ